MNLKNKFLLFALSAFTNICLSQAVVVNKDEQLVSYFGYNCNFLEDTTNSLSINEIIASNDFISCNSEVPNLGV